MPANVQEAATVLLVAATDMSKTPYSHFYILFVFYLHKYDILHYDYGCTGINV